MNKIKKLWVLVAVLSLGMQGCHLFYPQQMFRTAGYEVSEIDSALNYNPYLISPDDEFQLTVFTNSGEKLVDPTGSYAGISKEAVGMYVVETDSTVKLPVLGKIRLGGMSVENAEALLEKEYAAFFNEPFVKIKISNQRIIVFPGGEGGAAKVISLQNRNTTLLEALALAGGIVDGKAYRVKLIRGNPEHPRLYELDLSTVEGMKYGGVIVQANDVIYVEPRKRYIQKIAQGVMPYLTLISTVLLVYKLFE